MRSSLIWHREKDRLVIVYEDYLRICDGNHTAAQLLAVFEDSMNDTMDQSEDARQRNQALTAQGLPPEFDQEDLWTCKTYQDLEDDLLGDAKEDTIRKAMKLLKTKDFVETRTNPKYPWDRTLQYRLNVQNVQKALDQLPPSPFQKTGDSYATRS